MENNKYKIGDRVKITKSTAIHGDEVIGKYGTIERIDGDGDPLIKLDKISESYGRYYVIDRTSGDECEVLEEPKNVVTSIDRDNDGKLVATVEEPSKEELYKITFVGKDSELNFVGVGSPRVEGSDVYIMSPDNKQAVVDKSKFLYFVIEPYNED